MLIDDVTIKLSAGHGGKGDVSFSSAKNVKGPTGGNGGDGGSIYFEGIADLTALQQFRFKKEINAENGKNGQPRLNDGPAGKDLVLKIPLGTVIHNLESEETKEIMHLGERLLLAQGGKGGKGNFYFRSSRNTTPMESQPGLPGENATLRLELKYIADVGFIGLPNVGKSSLLNTLTNTKSKVANYPFTTLEPNLGIYYSLILADIPGLIEGASQGKGLGIKFLRHIERTKVLFHFISAESEDHARDYEIIRKELGEYNKELLQKPEYIFLTKTDLVDEKKLKEITKALKKINSKIIPLSIYNEDSLKSIKEILNEIMEKK